jgi:hypothetical protein
LTLTLTPETPHLKDLYFALADVDGKTTRSRALFALAGE